jgi:hypothetical protein
VLQSGPLKESKGGGVVALSPMRVKRVSPLGEERPAEEQSHCTGAVVEPAVVWQSTEKFNVCNYKNGVLRSFNWTIKRMSFFSLDVILSNWTIKRMAFL